MVDPQGPSKLSPLLRLLLVGGVAAIVCTLLLRQVLWINGTYFHRYTFQHVAAGRIYPAMLLAAAPGIAAQWVRNKKLFLMLLCVSLFAMQLLSNGIPREPWSMDRVAGIVTNPSASSYFTDAEKFLPLVETQSLSTFLKNFPELSVYCHIHAREKAPGQILYFMALLELLGPTAHQAAACVGGIGTMLLAALGVPCVYAMARQLEIGREATRALTTFYSLLPGMVVITPTFDQVHPAFVALIVATWLIALSTTGRKSVTAAVVCGLITFISSFLAYAPLTIGVMCVGVAGLRVWQGRATVRQVAIRASVVIASLAGAYLLLWLWSGFDPIRMYRQAALNEQGNIGWLPIKHIYPYTLPSDLKDFMLAAGWITLPLILLGTWRCRERSVAGVVAVCWLQVGIVWLSGLLKCETARIWLFLQPIALIPVGVELASWPKSLRVTAFILLVIVTTCVSQNLVFIPEWG